ncbi:hypothetical protein IOCL2690_000040800 [Leishmania lindenbergi]|uniref:Uncharacterized protein n=1 Tax=Leishmania lindenbergi TaxID=651832 RepID=A0AAW3B0E1_9TRYP
MKFIHVSAGAPHGLIHRPAVSHCHWYTSTRRGSPLAPYLRLRDTANSVLAAAIVLVSFVFWLLIELYFVAPLREVDAFVPAAVREELRGDTLQAPLTIPVDITLPGFNVIAESSHRRAARLALHLSTVVFIAVQPSYPPRAASYHISMTPGPLSAHPTEHNTAAIVPKGTRPTRDALTTGVQDTRLYTHRAAVSPLPRTGLCRRYRLCQLHRVSRGAPLW